MTAQANAATNEIYPFYEYQNKRTDLPIIRIDVNIPIYRMANFRTRTAHLKYIRDHDKPTDFFISAQENESAQQAQHDILVTFARQGRAESISPIFEELEKEDQREPLLITAGAVVVNGNRRLAAMRELFTESPHDYRGFSHVDCAVLPENVTLDEIREIEVRLQMRPDTKLPYGWIDEGLAIQELMESGRTIKQIADLMNKKKSEVERAACALREADIYLKEWFRDPGEYQYVEEAEQFFGDLAKALSGKQGEDIEGSRRIAWVLAANSKNLHRRVYDYNFSFGKRADEVLANLADRLDIDLTTRRSYDQDDLDIDLIGDHDDTSLEPIIDVFDDFERRPEVEAELIAICDSILEKDRQGQVGRRALVAIQGANNKLQEVDFSTADPATYGSIETQLNTILERVRKLKGNLQSYIQ